MKVLYASLDGEDVLSAEPGADSAILRVGEPVFLEEPADAWRTEVALALHVSRLGLHIPVEHARRHYDAVAAVHLLRPAVGNAGGVPALFRDRAIAPGSWITLDMLEGTIGFDVARRSLRADDRVALDASLDLTLEELRADEIVAALSRTMTLKTGDMIILAGSSVGLGAPAFDTSVKVCVSGIPSLSVRIK